MSCLRSVEEPRIRGQGVSPCCGTQSEPRTPRLTSSVLIQTCLPQTAVSVLLTSRVLLAFGSRMETPKTKCGSSGVASIHLLRARLFTSRSRRAGRRRGRGKASAQAGCRPAQIDTHVDSWCRRDVLRIRLATCPLRPLDACRTVNGMGPSCPIEGRGVSLMSRFTPVDKVW